VEDNFIAPQIGKGTWKIAKNFEGGPLASTETAWGENPREIVLQNRPRAARNGVREGDFGTIFTALRTFEKR